jgi:hypothetical protein
MRFLLPAVGSFGGPGRPPGWSRIAVIAAFGGGALVSGLLHVGAPRRLSAPRPTEVRLVPVPAVSVLSINAPASTEPVESPAPAAPEADVVGSSGVERTPLGEDEAAVYLARAWVAVAGSPPSQQALSVVWAQWAHETGRGRRMSGYNFAGIKGNGPDGDSFVAWTREVTPNPGQRTRETFRAYSTPEGGAHDYVRLLANRYPVAFRAASRGDVARFVRALDLGGYFTDSDRAYARALASLSRECLERSVPRRALEVMARGALVPAREPTSL